MTILTFNEALNKHGVDAGQVKSVSAPTQAPQPQGAMSSPLLNPAKESLNGLKTLYGGGDQGIANKLKQDVQAGAQDIQNGNVLKGVAKAGLRTAGDVAGAVYAPIGAAIGATGIGKAYEGIQKNVEQGKGLVGNAVDKFTNIPAVQNFATAHPNAGEDFNRGMNLGFSAAETGKIDPKTALERTKTQVTKPLTDLSQGVEDLTDPLKVHARNITDSQPAQIMQRVARIPKGKQAQFENMAGESVGNYLTKRGIYGNIDEISTKLYDRFTKSKDVADQALATLPGTYEPAPIKTALADLLQRELRVSSEGAPSPILERVRELNSKIGKQGLNMSEINEAKRLYEKNVKVDYLKQNLPESVARANNLDSAIRKWQLKQAKTLGLKNLDKINKETQLSKQLMDHIGQEYSGQAGNNAMSLTDWIMLSGGDPSAIGGFLIKKGFSSKGVQSAIAKALNRNKPVLGHVGAEMGPSEVPRLNAPTSNFRSQVSGSTPIKIAPRGGNMEITGRDGVMTSKPQPPQSQEILQKPSSQTTSKVRNSQGGYINLAEIAKSIDNVDVDRMMGFVDAVNRGRTPTKEIMKDVQRIADEMNLESRFGTNNTLAKDLNIILDIKRQNTKKSMKK